MPSRSNRNLVAAAFVVVVGVGLGSASPALAQGDARAAYQRGQEAYNQGRYEDATREFQAAYDIDPRPALLYNLAQSLERSGKLVEAVDALNRYLAAAQDAPNRAEAQLKLRNLQDRLDRTSIRIAYEAPGAAIAVDNQQWGLTPRPDPIRVSPGTHTVRVTRDGYSPFSARVIVPAGQVLDVEVTLEEAVGAGAGGAGAGGGGEGGGGEGGAGGGGEGGGEGAGEGAGVTEEEGGSLLPLILLAGGGALVAGGAVVGFLALGAANDAPASTGVEADQARTLALVSDVLVGVGVVTAAVGAYFMFFSGETDPQAAGSVQVMPAVAPTFAGAAATVRF